MFATSPKPSIGAGARCIIVQNDVDAVLTVIVRPDGAHDQSRALVSGFSQLTGWFDWKKNAVPA